LRLRRCSGSRRRNRRTKSKPKRLSISGAQREASGDADNGRPFSASRPSIIDPNIFSRRNPRATPRRTVIDGASQSRQVVQLQSSNFFSLLRSFPRSEATLAAAASGNFNQVAQQIVDIFVQVASIERRRSLSSHSRRPETCCHRSRVIMIWRMVCTLTDRSISRGSSTDSNSNAHQPRLSVETPAPCLFLSNIHHLK